MGPLLVKTLFSHTLLKLLGCLLVVTINHCPVHGQSISQLCFDETDKVFQSDLIRNANNSSYIKDSTRFNPGVLDYSNNSAAVESICSDAGGQFVDFAANTTFTCQTSPFPKNISFVNFGDCYGANCTRSELEIYLPINQELILESFGFNNCVPILSPASSPVAVPTTSGSSPTASAPQAASPASSPVAVPTASGSSPTFSPVSLSVELCLNNTNDLLSSISAEEKAVLNCTESGSKFTCDFGGAFFEAVKAVCSKVNGAYYESRSDSHFTCSSPMTISATFVDFSYCFSPSCAQSDYDDVEFALYNDILDSYEYGGCIQDAASPVSSPVASPQQGGSNTPTNGSPTVGPVAVPTTSGSSPTTNTPQASPVSSSVEICINDTMELLNSPLLTVADDVVTNCTNATVGYFTCYFGSAVSEGIQAFCSKVDGVFYAFSSDSRFTCSSPITTSASFVDFSFCFSKTCAESDYDEIALAFQSDVLDTYEYGGCIPDDTSPVSSPVASPQQGGSNTPTNGSPTVGGGQVPSTSAAVAVAAPDINRTGGMLAMISAILAAFFWLG